MDIQQQLQEIKAVTAELRAQKQNRETILQMLKASKARRVEEANDKFRPKANLILKWLGTEIESEPNSRFSTGKVKVYINGDLTITEHQIKWKDKVVLTKGSYEADEWQGKILEIYPEAQLAAARDEMAKEKASAIQEDDEFTQLLYDAGLREVPTLPSDFLATGTRIWASDDQWGNSYETIVDYDFERNLYLVGKEWRSRDQLVPLAEYRAEEERKRKEEEARQAAESKAREEAFTSAPETTSTPAPKWELWQFYDVTIEEIQQLNTERYNFEIIATGTGTRFGPWDDPYPVLFSRIRITSVPEAESQPA